MSKLGFREVDTEGLETLEALSSADRLNRWIFETIRPYCRGKVLEIGSGIGNISQEFLKEGYDITLSDVRGNYLDILKQKFSNQETLGGVIKVNLASNTFEKDYAEIIDTFDSVFALNVIEHIHDDNLSITNARKLLRANGKIIILVPAYQALYNRFDKELEHYRRYSSQRLNELLRENDLVVVHSQYFNLAGILGWFISGSLLNKKTIPARHIQLYNSLVSFFRLVDKITLHKVGLSVIAVGENRGLPQPEDDKRPSS